MKYLKYFESDDHSKFVEILYDKILNKKIINNFIVNNIQPVIEWYYDDYLIYATPYWEDELILPVNIMIDGYDIEEHSYKLSKMNSINDVEKTLKYYYTIISDTTEKLNKRRTFIELLPHILNLDFDINVNIDGIDFYINSIVDYDATNNELIVAMVKDIESDTFYMNEKTLNINNIKTDDIIKMLDIIYTKYPHIIRSRKYNIL
jgi:hypothetical protein